MAYAQNSGTLPHMDALNGKWKLELLYQLSGGTVRWSTLTHSIPKAAPNVLTRQLRKLEEDGLVLRIVTSAQPPQVIEYALSGQGRQLIPMLEALARWEKTYHDNTDTTPDFSDCQRVLSSRWMLSILTLISVPLRFGSIQSHFEDLSRGVLAAQLGELRDMGFVYQKRYDIFPPRVEYVLSEKGRDLLDILLPNTKIKDAENA